MTKNELLEYLKENLSISLDFKEGGRAYWDGNHQLKVVIKLGEDKLCESECSLPNDKQERPY
jgi:hypothetical protein